MPAAKRPCTSGTVKTLQYGTCVLATCTPSSHGLLSCQELFCVLNFSTCVTIGLPHSRGRNATLHLFEAHTVLFVELSQSVSLTVYCVIATGGFGSIE